MATAKKTPVSAPELVKVPTPPTAKELVGECAETGTRVVHVAQFYFRRVEGVVQTCGTSAEGMPDGQWKELADAEVPPKARSMLGMA